MKDRKLLDDTQRLMNRFVDLLKLKATLSQWDPRDGPNLRVQLGSDLIFGDEAIRPEFRKEFDENTHTSAIQIVERVERYLFDEAEIIRTKLAELGVKIEK